MPIPQLDRTLPLRGTMNRSSTAVLLALLALATPGTAVTQEAPGSSFHSGLKFKGAHIYNRSSLDTEQRELTEANTGWSAGIEIVGRHIGIGLTGFTAGTISEFAVDETTFVVLAEANYYVPIRVIRLAPYVGVHTGLGSYTSSYVDEPYLPSVSDRSPASLGLQFGARWQPIALGSIDVQWRRLSESAAQAQDRSFERSQILLGVTLF
jgi:hypothetical protein